MKEKANDRSLRNMTHLRQDLNGAIAAKYGPYLEPGEGMTVEVERTKDFVAAKIVLEGSGETLRLELEGARLESDQQVTFDGTLDDSLDAVVDFLDLILEEFFDNERFVRSNETWKLGEYMNHIIRYRSSLQRPDLDALADAWLAANGDPSLQISTSTTEEE